MTAQPGLNPDFRELKIDEQNQIIPEGIYLVDKPTGWSSFDVVARVRRLSGVKKVGHAGTLDPFATGLLIIMVGKQYTKLSDHYLGHDKTYFAEVSLGENSTSFDPEGEISQISLSKPSLAQIKQALAILSGDYLQVPPIYSAIKLQGKRAYQLAREGKQPEMKLRSVKVISIDNLDYQYPFVRFKIEVSSGTYIRSIANDLGTILGTGAYLKSLRRLAIGSLRLSNQ
ncbi:tRNA pseudouridine(55) synthase TruB [Candidatus Saccharibacteria bacterium]|nr:tRNA pseudouridine(55) synthase TruB [Candidatus Saccharibacteria bacterium]MCB9834552.1 tRNA pseudouridine(55) synthase TruB [Candidatus Nomurabacteria bacterium]